MIEDGGLSTVIGVELPGLVGGTSAEAEMGSSVFVSVLRVEE